MLDASGLIVAPGFVDLHTHYDSQIFWDPWCTMSGWHGVTSVVIGNCGDAPSSSIPALPGTVQLKWHLHGSGGWTASEIPDIASQGQRIAGLAGPLAEFLRGERPPIATAAEGRTVLRLVLACYESAEQGRRVTLSPDD